MASVAIEGAADGAAEAAEEPGCDLVAARSSAKRPGSYWKILFVVLAVLAFAIIYNLPLRMGWQEQKCLAMVAFVCILWATEAIPLWVTSLTIPMLIVVCDIILKAHGAPMSAADAATRELAKLADPNVILLMGGFTIAGALHKYGIDLRLAIRIQGLVGGGAPKLYIFAMMWVGFIISMFCNNVAAPVVTFFFATPVLHRVHDRRYCCCMVMAIAFACNIGGMPTPIASPQNAQALKVINEALKDDISFLSWMTMALPVCLILLPVCWIWLLIWWKPTLEAIPQPPSQRSLLGAAAEEHADGSMGLTAQWDLRHTYVVLVSLLTVILWCLFDFLKDFFGSMGVVGLIPIILLYGPGVMSGEDFKRIDWGILMLLGGGAALGDAVQSSGLLDALGKALLDAFEDAGVSVYSQFMFFNVVIIIVANFISHTVAAITMLGVLGKVGHSVQKGRAFVLGGVICDSGACGLPVSSFPNILAYGVRDQHGEPYLKASDYFVPAVVMELVVLLIMGTLGWALADTIPSHGTPAAFA
eukprot:TRINITY_DN45299_c0_g1_i1.p1 TRINITY_DN45299_c0_g1~~TRINITY_DN45299_c0_g1_i1.p1  ORF type:complete len:569 (-),score=139.59 TRINITY_DN45299_c0_g1_i1:318-1907(-)